MKKWILSVSWVLCVWSVWAGTYSDWASANGNLSALGDADQDGMVNLVEFATVSNPQASDSFLFLVDPQGSGVVVRWHQRKQMTDVTMTLEGKDDLSAAWAAVTVDPADRSVTSVDADTEEVQVTLKNTGATYFVRLQVALQSSVNPVTSYVYPSSAILVATPGDGEVSLVWMPMSGVNDYVVYYGTSASVTTNDAAVSATGTQATVTGLTNGQMYYFSVQANDGSGGGSWLSDAVAARPQAVATGLAAPQQVTAEGGNNEVVLDWDPVSGATGYTLYWSNTAGVTTSGERIKNVTAPYTHPNLANSTDYFYILQAENTLGMGQLSDEVQATTFNHVLPAPLNVVLTPNGTTMTLAWDPVLGASSYKVYREIGGSSATVSIDSTLVASPTSNVYEDTGVAVGQYARYRVAAVGPHGDSALSPDSPYGRSNELLFKPEKNRIYAYTHDSDSLYISWNSYSDADSYTLYWSKSPNVTQADTAITGLTNRYYIHTGLTRGVTYYYRVGAVNQNGETFSTMEASKAPIDPSTEIPVPPKSFNIQVVTAGQQCTITWDDIPGATEYDLYRARYPDCYKSADYTVIPNVTSPYTDSGLTYGEDYYYYVRPRNAHGDGDIFLARYYNSGVQPQATTAPPAAPPQNLAAQVADRTIVLEWDESPDAGSYAIYCSTSPTLTTASDRVERLHSPFVHHGLQNGTTYYYAVARINQMGEGPLSSVVSAVPASASVAPHTPQGLSASYAGYRRAGLSWDPVPGATSYVLYWQHGTSMDDDAAYITGISEPSFIHKGLSAGENYTYAVMAVNHKGVSSKSPTTTFKPTHRDTSNEVSGYEKSFYQYTRNYGSQVRERFWIPEHLYQSGDFKGILVCDSHGAIKGLDRNNSYRRFAERNDILILRLGVDDYNASEAVSWTEQSLIWLQETYGYKRDLIQLPKIVVGLSSSARSVVKLASEFTNTLAVVCYAQPFYSTSLDRNIPVLCTVGSNDDLGYAKIISESQGPKIREKYGHFVSEFFMPDYSHNSIGMPYHTTLWLDAVIDMRLGDEGQLLPVNTEDSVHVLYDATFSGDNLNTVSNVSVDPTYTMYSPEVWMPTMELGNEWQYHIDHPYAYWIETPQADFIQVNEPTTLSAKVGDVNSGGSVTSAVWSLASGPGNATFGSTSSLQTTVQFDAPGTYTVQLAISDNEGYSRTQSLQIEVR